MALFLGKYLKNWKEKRAEKRRILTLEKLIHREYTFLEEMSKRSNQYIIDNVAYRKDIDYFVKNCEEIKKTLVDKLISLDHTYRSECGVLDMYPYLEYPGGIYKLSLGQLLRVYLLMESLEKKEFNKQIGTYLEEAVKNLYTESGGLILFDKTKNLVLYPVESRFASKKDLKYKETYKMSDVYFKKPTVLYYHFHASKEDCSEFAGPSQGYTLNNPLTGELMTAGDIAGCDLTTIIEGESHNIVITKLKGKMFNIDYYSGKKVNKMSEITVVDLGNYNY